MEQNEKTKIGYEVTQNSFKGNIELPKEGVNALLYATSKLIDSVRVGSEKVGNMLCNSASTIGKPIGKLIEGKTNEIELANQFITARLMYVKETNATMHLAYVAEELNKKVENGEEIPEEIISSDNLNLIQDNASSTSNEEMLRLWAKLYTEEICKEGTVSRKAIKLVETLDANIAKIIENEIFPYCDSKGFYFGPTKNISNLILAMDYGFVDNISILISPEQLNTMFSFSITDNCKIYIYPNYTYSSSHNGIMYKLTTSGLEIYNCLKLKKTEEHLNVIYENISRAAKHWKIPECFASQIQTNNINDEDKFIICDNYNNVIYPKESKFKTLDEYISFIEKNDATANEN